jgi:hypothetical protein
MTGTAGASNPQVRRQIRPSPQVSEIGPENTLKVETRIERRGFRTSCPTAPACKVADRYVNQGDRPIVTETPGAVLSRVQCGTTAGHMSSGSEPEAPE